MDQLPAVLCVRYETDQSQVMLSVKKPLKVIQIHKVKIKSYSSIYLRQYSSINVSLHWLFLLKHVTEKM